MACLDMLFPGALEDAIQKTNKSKMDAVWYDRSSLASSTVAVTSRTTPSADSGHFLERRTEKVRAPREKIFK